MKRDGGVQHRIPTSELEDAIGSARVVAMVLAGAICVAIAAVAWFHFGSGIEGQTDAASQRLRLLLDGAATALLVVARVSGRWLVTRPLDSVGGHDLGEVALSRLFVGSILAGGLAVAGAIVGLVIVATVGHAVDFYVFAFAALVLIVAAAPSRRVWSGWIDDFEFIVRHS